MALTDLDEIILGTRAERPRAAISDAIKCYRAGAYAAAITSTWIAICYDFIDKLVELSMSGNLLASDKLRRLEHIHSKMDVEQSLAFERDLLRSANKDFELIAERDFLLLKRIQEDRNRCAHPSLSAEEDMFAPSPELVRGHIHAAYSILLKHSAAQGKSAIARLVSEVGSDYFPERATEAANWFSHGPLKRPRESLVRNLVVLFIKNFLEKGPGLRANRRILAALQGIKLLHGALFEETIHLRFARIGQELQNNQLGRLLEIVVTFPEHWSVLTPDVQTRVVGFIRELPGAEAKIIEPLLSFPPLSSCATEWVKQAEFQMLENAISSIESHQTIISRIAWLYTGTKSADIANEMSRRLIAGIHHLRDFECIRIMHTMNRATDIKNSSGASTLLRAIQFKLPPEKFTSLIKELELERVLESRDSGVDF